MRNFIKLTFVFAISFIAGAIFGCDWMTSDEAAYEAWKIKYGKSSE